MKLENKVKAVKQVKSYGNLHLSSKDLPEVKNLSLGDKITLAIEVDVRGLRKPDRWEISEEGMKPGDIRADINILGVTLPSKKQ
jgi:hypothetical protein